MKILHILPSIESTSGGPPRSTLATIKAIYKSCNSCKNDLISTNYLTDNKWLEEIDRLLPKNSYLKLFDSHTLFGRSISYRLLHWVFLNVSRYDLVNIRSMMHPLSTICGYICFLKNIPYVVTPHGTLSEYTFKHRKYYFKLIYSKLFEKKVLDKAKYIQATSLQEKEEISSLDINTDIRVIPHPFETKSSTKYKNNDDKILFLSRLDPMKGIDKLINVFSLLVNKKNNIELIIAGDGDDEYVEYLKSKTVNLNIDNNVKFVGFASGRYKSYLLNNSSLFILPSYRENYGIAAVEAMDAGLPIIITKEVEIYDLVKEYEAGLVINNSKEEIYRSICYLLDNRKLRRKMGKSGRKLVKEKFSPRVIGDRVVKLYKDSLNKNI